MKGLVRLLRYLEPYRVRVAGAFVAMLLGAGLMVALPLLAQQLADVDLNPAALPSRFPTPLLVVLVFMTKGLTGYFGQYLMHWVGERVVRDLRDELVESTLQQSVRYFGQRSGGHLISRVVNDVEKIRIAVTEKLYDMLSQPLVAVALVGYLLYKDWRLALVCFIGIPLAVHPIMRLGRKLRGASTRSQERMADVSKLVHEMSRGIRVVKAFAMEGFELGRFRRATEQLFRANMRAWRVVAVTPPLMELLAGLGVAGAFLYGRHAVRSGHMTQGEVIAFFTALLMLYQPFKRLTRVLNAFAPAMAACERVWEVVDHPVGVSERDGALKLGRARGVVRFEHVSFRYDEALVLSDIDLEIGAGERLAVVGPSGSGKSTLANLILRFHDPSQGRVLLDGTDLRDIRVKSLREQIALVTQDVVVFNDSVRANIAYGHTEMAHDRIEQAARTAHAHEFIRALPQGYDTLLGEAGARLSGGERQRICIARALLKDAPLLILDEATSALDAESEEQVHLALDNLMCGRTTLIIAHRFSTVRSADRIVVLESGRILESGTHAELLRREGLYARLMDLQARGGATS